MNRDVTVIGIVSAIVGLCNGIFGMLFTLYLDYLNISLPTMGIMYSVSGLLAFFVLIFFGVYSDVWGRKVVYSASLLLQSISLLLVPMLRGIWELTVASITNEMGLRSRMAVHSTLVFEHVKLSFAKIIARIQGVELALNAIGFTIAGLVLLCLGFQGSFIAMGLMLLGVLAVFQIVREPSRPNVKRKSIREMYRFDIPKQLKILSVFNLMYQIGFSICHSVFIFTLFFSKKFMVDPLTLSLILGIHHFTFGLPMLIISRLFARQNLNYKKIFMVGNMLTGLPHILTALIPSLIPAVAIWFMHDIFGAAISTPAQQTLTQTYSRDGQRGKDVNVTSAFGSIGLVVGPVIGGFLAGINISLPFLVGGIIIVTATLILIPLDGKPMRTRMF